MRTETDLRRKSKFEATVGVGCFVVGLLAPLVGGVLTGIEWVLGSVGHPWLHIAGTTLFIVGIPLILFAGVCLDWADECATAYRHPHNTQRGAAALAQITLIASALSAALLAPAAIHAQQTIFNVPSTDVLEKGKVYVELDASLKPTNGVVSPTFSSFVPRVVVGVGRRIEIGLNVTGNVQPGPDATTLVPTIKWKAFESKDDGWAVVVGDNLVVPVRNRTYKTGNYVYAEASKTFKSGTKITFGGYDFTRNVVAAANRAGGQFGFEHPVHNKFTLAADWLTGKHSAGYFTPGAVFKIHPQVTGYAGYSLGNQNLSKGNHFFLLELGYNFN